MMKQNSELFTPIKIGDLELKNRIVMAPMTRGRADEDRVPTAIMADYYSRRASAGLIISEATAVSKMGFGWFGAPGIYSAAQIEGWKKVTGSVHATGGKIFAQLWHMGRVSHPDFLDGETPVAPSAVKPEGFTRTAKGKRDYVTPRALTLEEIAATVSAYALAASNAIKAGFDGVEIHGANGYLIDQFLRDGTNKRDDIYGGAKENRSRFLLEVTDAVVAAVGKGRVGVRLSPTGAFNDMSDSNPEELFCYAASELSRRQIAYLHTMEPLPGHPFGSPLERVTPKMRKIFKGPFMVNGGFTGELGAKAIKDGEADLIAYGIPFISNADLVEKIAYGASWNEADFSTFYTGGEKGYLD